jgi:hypothetical protein
MTTPIRYKVLLIIEERRLPGSLTLSTWWQQYSCQMINLNQRVEEECDKL